MASDLARRTSNSGVTDDSPPISGEDAELSPRLLLRLISRQDERLALRQLIRLQAGSNLLLGMAPSAANLGRVLARPFPQAGVYRSANSRAARAAEHGAHNGTSTSPSKSELKCPVMTASKVSQMPRSAG